MTAEAPAIRFGQAQQGTITLFGYLGGRNLGDDAMLQGFFDAAIDSGRSFIVLARDPDAVEPPRGIQVQVRRAGLRAAASAMLSSRAMVRIGGTSFHDEYEDTHAAAMRKRYIQLSALYLLPRLLGRRVAALGVGFGAIRRRSTRLLARLAMGACSIIVVRDPASLAVALDPIGARNAQLGVDLAFLSTFPEENREKSRVGISLVDLTPFGLDGPRQDRFWQEATAAALSGMAQGAPVSLFAFKDNEAETDVPVALRLQSWLAAQGRDVRLLRHSDGLGAIRAEIAQCDVFLATRYHAAILAGQARARLIIVPYNEKLRHYARDMQIPGEALIEPGAQGPFSVTPAIATPSPDFAQRLSRLRSAIQSLLELSS